MPWEILMPSALGNIDVLENIDALGLGKYLTPSRTDLGLACN